MSKPHEAHGKYARHQHPLIYVLIFLAVALGALALITANHKSSDTGSGGTPGPDAVGFQCERGTPEGFELSDVEGKTVAEAEQWAAGEGKTIRVIAEDGKALAATADYQPDRVNVQVEAGTVTRYCGNG